MNVTEVKRLQRHVTTMFAELAAERDDRDPGKVLESLVSAALRRIAGASSASVTTKDAKGFATAFATDDVARAADRVQYEVPAGPAPTALRTGAPCHLSDTRRDRQWPAAGTRLAAQGVLSALSVPLGAASADGVTVVAAGLNLYAGAVDAFSPTSVLVATILAGHAGPSWVAASRAARIDNLERALVTAKDIDPAIGLLMAKYSLGHDEALRLLREVSNRSNRKVADLAGEIIELGELPASARRLL